MLASYSEAQMSGQSNRVCDGCGTPESIHDAFGGKPVYTEDDNECGPRPERCGEWVTPSEWTRELTRLRAVENAARLLVDANDGSNIRPDIAFRNLRGFFR